MYNVSLEHMFFNLSFATHKFYNMQVSWLGFQSSTHGLKMGLPASYIHACIMNFILMSHEVMERHGNCTNIDGHALPFSTGSQNAWFVTHATPKKQPNWQKQPLFCKTTLAWIQWMNAFASLRDGAAWLLPAGLWTWTGFVFQVLCCFLFCIYCAWSQCQDVAVACNDVIWTSRLQDALLAWLIFRNIQTKDLQTTVACKILDVYMDSVSSM